MCGFIKQRRDILAIRFEHTDCNQLRFSSIDSPQENIGDELFLDENISTDDAVSSIDSPQENIGDELFLDENITTDDNFENVEFDDDKISISSVEEPKS